MHDKLKEFLDNQEAIINERRKTIKKGSNVIHLEYIGEISDFDLNEIEQELGKAKLEFSWYNKSGIAYANLEDYNFTTFLTIHPEIIAGLLGVGSSATWDLVKWTVGSIWEKVRGKKKNLLRGGGIIEEKDITFGMQIILDKNTQLNFELKGNVEKDVIIESLDKALDFLKTESRNKEYQIPDFVHYSPVLKKWIKVNVMEELRKKVNKKK